MVCRFYDWDDTIVLSRKALYLSYKKALEKWNIQFDFQYFNDFIYNDATKFLLGLKFSMEEIAEIKKLKEQYYMNDFFNEIIFKFPEINPEETYIIVTNTNQDLVKEMLMKKYGTTEYFSNYIGTYNGIKRKPAPDLYIAAFESIKYKWKPNDELHIYEDSVEGLLSAASFIEMYRKRIKNFKLHHVTHTNPFVNI